MTLKAFLSHTIPTSIAGAMANNEILQIVVFSMFFGIAGASLGQKFNAPLVAALDVVSHIMLKVTGYVMYVAPLAIFAAISSVIATQGLGILLNYASFIGGYYVAILLTCMVLLAVGYMVLKKEVFRLVSMLKDPVLVAFTTSSSEAAYPKRWSSLSVLVARAISPLSFCRSVTPLTWWALWCIALSPRCLSPGVQYSPELHRSDRADADADAGFKGIAGVPRSSLVVLAATIPSFNIPVAGILLLMGIDHFLDMGRSAINVLGNGIATAMLSQNEGAREAETELVEQEA